MRKSSFYKIYASLFGIVLIIATLLSGCFSGCGGGGSTPAQTPASSETVAVKITNSTSIIFTVTAELAITQAERSTGLSNRDSLGADDGMFFVFEGEGKHSFWMKDTLISLDMIFISSAGVIVDINHNAVPGDLTPYTPGADAKYVLEVNGGYCQSNNINIGDNVAVPEGYQTGIPLNFPYK